MNLGLAVVLSKGLGERVEIQSSKYKLAYTRVQNCTTHVPKSYSMLLRHMPQPAILVNDPLDQIQWLVLHIHNNTSQITRFNVVLQPHLI